MSQFYLLEKGYFLCAEFYTNFGWFCTATKNPDEAMIFNENHSFFKADLIQDLIERGYLIKVDVSEYNDFKIF